MATYSVDSNVRKKIFEIPTQSSNIHYSEPISSIPTLTNSSIKDISGKISKKPLLITKAELENLGKDINLVGYDPIAGLIENSNKTFSPKLLNWVEPFEIKGSVKTLFYTEVNTDLKVGDRVFIVNGNYDSDLLIENNKYKKGRDGYKILNIDKCKIVLDIDYTGVVPYVESKDDDFIKVYYIRDKSEFLHANRAITTRGGSFDYKFSYYQNNIAFIDSGYNSTSATNWGANTGISTSPGFFVKSLSYTPFTWSDITTNIMSGSFSYALSPTYTSVNKIKIMNSDFTYNGQEFKEGYVYKWVVGPVPALSKWTVDITYLRPYISKNNFRDGNFRGVWNSGIYGQYKTKIKWHGDDSTWNVGTLINTIWKKGKFNTLYTASQSYFSSFDQYGLPYQKVNSPNNAGRGYNFVANSFFENSEIVNGSFYSTNFGTESSSFTQSVVENEILNIDTPYVNKIERSFFNDCKFTNSHLIDSELKNTRSINSKFEKVKSINSYFNNSVLKNSSYNSDNIIKVLAYDQLSASEFLSPGTTYSSTNSIDQVVFKFYINKSGYERLRTGDIFYLKGLKINNDSKDVINFFDKKFKIGTWTEYNDEILSGSFSKVGYEYSAFLSTPADNSYTFGSTESSGSFYTEIKGENPNKNFYSIDIWVSRWNINTNVSSDINYSNIDIKNCYIVDSDFDSGLIENSDWNSGSHIESNKDNNITKNNAIGEEYNLSIDSNLYLTATLSIDSSYQEISQIKAGDIVFLDSIDFNWGTVSRIPDSYKVISVNNSVFKLKEISTNELISLSASNGYFYTDKAENRYGHIRKLKISKSNIKSGLFRRSYFSESLIQNLDYNLADKDFTNLEKIRNLVISDSIFSNNKNILSNAIYLNSFFVVGNDNWNSGIIQNSIWNGGTFSNGVIRDSRWIDGYFKSGLFYNSRTFNGIATMSSPYYYSENINSYYRKGISLPNNRNSWQNGEFLKGSFEKSDWEGGTFSGGKFELSKWYDGIFQNGTIGSKKLSAIDTKFYNGTVSFATVENATIYAEDTSLNSNIDQNINWLSGVFNDGLFGSNMLQTSTNSATWINGTFNGGEFISNAKWKNGSFNGGKFLSGYGWSQSDSTSALDYSWENGEFNGGEFGNSNGQTNSTWYTGEFAGGVFKGRTWNNGIFLYGEFQGSGGDPVGGPTSGNANIFVDAYSQSYWGKWKNGIVTNNKDKFNKDKKFFTVLEKSTILEKPNVSHKKAKFKNALWISGTFSHKNAEMSSSVWLDGAFERGKFTNSSFNPYVKRNNSSTPSFNIDETCYWENGSLDNSDFYISRWKNGNFIMGTGIGMIWENGIVNYMNAFNIFWEGGTWRNGNWYGSSFEYNGSISDDYTYSILKRGMSWSGTSSCHIWNIFLQPSDVYQVSYVTASNIGSGGWSSESNNISQSEMTQTQANNPAQTNGSSNSG